MKKVVRLGTRRSKLSLWQTNHIADLIRRHHADVDVIIREYRTRSDLNMSAPLRSISGTGLFTDALEAALLGREIDGAVHSLKDLPVKIADGLALAAVPKRGDHRDAIVSRSPAPGLRSFGKAPGSERAACADAPSCSRCVLISR